MEIEWPAFVVEAYGLDGARILDRLRSGNVDKDTVQRSLELLRTYSEVHRVGLDCSRANTQLMNLAQSLCNHAQNLGFWNQLLLLWPRMLRLADQDADPRIYTELAKQLAVVHSRRGNGEEALRVLERLVDSARFDNLCAEMQADLYHHLGTCYLWTGQTEQAFGILRRCVEITSEVHEEPDSAFVDPDRVRFSGSLTPIWESKAYALNQLGNLHLFSRDIEQAWDAFQESLNVLIEHNEEENLACVAYQGIGRLLLYSQRYNEAIPVIRRGLNIRRRRREQEAIALNTIYLAAANLGRGTLSNVEGLLSEALEISTNLGSASCLILCHLNFGRLASLQNDPETALLHWQQAMQLLGSTSMPAIELNPFADSIPGQLDETLRVCFESMLKFPDPVEGVRQTQ